MQCAFDAFAFDCVEFALLVFRVTNWDVKVGVVRIVRGDPNWDVPSAARQVESKLGLGFQIGVEVGG